MSGVPDVELLQAILDRAGIKDWSLLVLGDGSGNSRDGACGWAGVLIDRESRGRRLFKGGMDPASINMAELMPYYQALTWFEGQYGYKRRQRIGTIKVHVITDSQVIANWGNQTANLSLPLPKTGIMYHAGLRELVRLGYQLHYHWAPRSTSLLNWAADLIAALCRRELLRSFNPTMGDSAVSYRAMEAIRSVVFCNPTTGEPINIHDLNPDEETQCPPS